LSDRGERWLRHRILAQLCDLKRSAIGFVVVGLVLARANRRQRDIGGELLTGGAGYPIELGLRRGLGSDKLGRARLGRARYFG